MSTRSLFLLLSLLVAATSAAAPGARPAPAAVPAVTKSNWYQHPRIVAVRNIVQALEQALKAKIVQKETREVAECGQGGATKTLVSDSAGRVRRYELIGGSEDSSLAVQQTYDEGGVLRFVYVTGGDVHGGQLELRIYFDETGARLWEETKGPGLMGFRPESWPLKPQATTDPRGAYNADGC